MAKLPENIVLVRIDKEIWENWCEFCEERGLLTSKWAGFRLKDYMEHFGWEEIGSKKRLVDPRNRLMKEDFMALDKNEELNNAKADLREVEE